MIIGRHGIVVVNEVFCQRAISAAMLAEPVSDEDLAAGVRQLVPSQIETQPVSRSDRLFDVGHWGTSVQSLRLNWSASAVDSDCAPGADVCLLCKPGSRKPGSAGILVASFR